MSTPPPVAPDMADRVAQMVAAERATLNALVTEPEIEIVGVTSAMGAGAMGSAAADEWSLRLSLLRWREVQGTRQGGELRMCMLTNEAEVDRIVEVHEWLRGGSRHGNENDGTPVMLAIADEPIMGCTRQYNNQSGQRGHRSAAALAPPAAGAHIVVVMRNGTTVTGLVVEVDVFFVHYLVLDLFVLAEHGLPSDGPSAGSGLLPARAGG